VVDHADIWKDEKEGEYRDDREYEGSIGKGDVCTWLRFPSNLAYSSSTSCSSGDSVSEGDGAESWEAERCWS
jgi:hypothetical protein